MSNHTIAIGDNLFYLKKLSQDNKNFDVIYIDPPYNTGNKFSYNDNRTSHAWNDFISDRLKLAQTLLKKDWVIFISIDDSSLYDLKIICDDIFWKQNFLWTFITKQAVRSNAKHINTIHEYIISYSKDKKYLPGFKIKRINSETDGSMIKDILEKISKRFKVSGKSSAEKLLAQINIDYMNKKNISRLRNYSNVDENGEVFFPKDLSVPWTPNDLYIKEIDLNLPALSTRRRSSSKKFIKLFHENKLHFKGMRPYEKHYLKDAFDNVLSILDFYSRQWTNDLVKLGLRNLFDTPKPVELIKYLIRIATYGKDNAMILDFFAWSWTTWHAIMEINIEDNKKYWFYLIQLDEIIRKDTEQYKFALENWLNQTVDQLLLYRIEKVKEKLWMEINFNIINTK